MCAAGCTTSSDPRRTPIRHLAQTTRPIVTHLTHTVVAMPNEEPDSTSYHTVDDGQPQPSETASASLPSAPPAPSKVLDCLGKSPPRSQKPQDCCTTLRHTAGGKPPKMRAETVASGPPDCITQLRHPPCERTSPSSGRSARQAQSPSPGLIVRGRVFHVRVRVPRHLQATLGRSQPKALNGPQQAANSASR